MKKVLFLFAILLFVAAGCSTNEQVIPQNDEAKSGDINNSNVENAPTDWKVLTAKDVVLKYPSDWTVRNASNPKVASISIQTDSIANYRKDCGEGVGVCQEEHEKLKQRIASGAEEGTLSFQGGKGIFSGVCSSSVGSVPRYTLQFYKGDTIYILDLDDASGAACEQGQVYNDFLSVTQDTLVLK